MFPYIFKNICNKQKGYKNQDLESITYHLYSSEYIHKVYAADFDLSPQLDVEDKAQYTLLWVKTNKTQPPPFYGVYFSPGAHTMSCHNSSYFSLCYKFDMAFTTNMEKVWWFTYMKALYFPIENHENITCVMGSESLRIKLRKQILMSHTIIERNDMFITVLARMLKQ